MYITDRTIRRIKELCDQQNISINRLARLSKVSPSTLYRYLKSEHQDISIYTLKKLCNGLGISIAEFFSTDAFRR